MPNGWTPTTPENLPEIGVRVEVRGKYWPAARMSRTSSDGWYMPDPEGECSGDFVDIRDTEWRPING